MTETFLKSILLFIACGIVGLISYAGIASATAKRQRKEAFKDYSSVRDELPMDYEPIELPKTDNEIEFTEEMAEYITNKCGKK